MPLKEYIQETPNVIGNGGNRCVEPVTEQEIADVLAHANQQGHTVNIISGGTKRGFGGLLEQADILLSLAKHRGIVEHSVGDLTITVKSGTTLKEISDFLKPYGQRIPLDIPWPEVATIGGVVATNESGPKRLLHGSARDYVLGLRVVYPDGRTIRTGGKVVKNVAGYDMNKLFIGSMGTLGVISELTLKLKPLPKNEALMLIRFPNSQTNEIQPFVIHLLDSKMEPVAVELLNPLLSLELTGHHRYTLAVAFEDRKPAIQIQQLWVADHLPEGVEADTLCEEEAVQWWERFHKTAPNARDTAAYTKTATTEHGEITQAGLKIGSRNTDVLHLLTKAELLADQHGVKIKAHGGLGHGIAKVFAEALPEQLTSFILALRAETEARNGYVICTHLPLKLRQSIDVWGEKPAYFSLIEDIKGANDPNQILNRHRFVGGL